LFLYFVVSWFEKQRVVLLNGLGRRSPLESDSLENVGHPLQVVFESHPGETQLDTLHHLFTTVLILDQMTQQLEIVDLFGFIVLGTYFISHLIQKSVAIRVDQQDFSTLQLVSPRILISITEYFQYYFPCLLIEPTLSR